MLGSTYEISLSHYNKSMLDKKQPIFLTKSYCSGFLIWSFSVAGYATGKSKFVHPSKVNLTHQCINGYWRLTGIWFDNIFVYRNLTQLHLWHCKILCATCNRRKDKLFLCWEKD